MNPHDPHTQTYKLCPVSREGISYPTLTHILYNDAEVSCCRLIFPILNAKMGAEGVELFKFELPELHTMRALSGHRRVVLVEQGGRRLG